MRQASGSLGTRIAVVTAAVILIIAGLVVWLWWQAANSITNNPGPPATGSGPCLQIDSVAIQLVFADGHSVQACTRDMPACPNETISGTGGGQTSSVSEFTLNNGLRSSFGGYQLFVRFDAALPAVTGDQTLVLDPQVGLPGIPGSSPSSSGLPRKAVVEIAPRDPSQAGYTAISGSLTVSAGGGVARGTMEGNFSANAPAGSPVRFVGAFVCKH
jgi:hypothetical protein